MKEFVTLAFRGDELLLTSFQPVQADFKETISRILNTIVDATKYYDLKFFVLMYRGVNIGFTIVDETEKVLFSFGINIGYRTLAVKDAWFDGLKHLFKDGFMVDLFNENIRAISFLIRYGMKIVEHTETVTRLVYIN